MSLNMELSSTIKASVDTTFVDIYYKEFEGIVRARMTHEEMEKLIKLFNYVKTSQVLHNSELHPDDD